MTWDTSGLWLTSLLMDSTGSNTSVFQAILKGCYIGDIQRRNNWLENTYLQKRDPLYDLSTHPPSPVLRDLVDVLCSSGHEHMTGKERKWHYDNKHYTVTISNKETAPGTACQTVATQIHKCWLHRLLSPGFMIAIKILKYSCFLLSLGLFSIFFSLFVLLNPLPYQYLRKLLLGQKLLGASFGRLQRRRGRGKEFQTQPTVALPFPGDSETRCKACQKSFGYTW